MYNELLDTSLENTKKHQYKNKEYEKESTGINKDEILVRLEW